jgi:hypothetical protein
MVLVLCVVAASMMVAVLMVGLTFVTQLVFAEPVEINAMLTIPAILGTMLLTVVLFRRWATKKFWYHRR